MAERCWTDRPLRAAQAVMDVIGTQREGEDSSMSSSVGGLPPAGEGRLPQVWHPRPL
jgi:hypothetical protein